MNKTVEALWKRMSAHNETILIQDREGNIEGYRCTFSDPASSEEIQHLESALSVQLPSDYREFLETCNGCILFDHPMYGGENIFYSISELIHLHHNRNQDKHLLQIAYIFQDHIVIDLDKVSKGDSHYLFVKPYASVYEPGGNLLCNFENWFFRFVSSNGSPYWNWNIG